MQVISPVGELTERFDGDELCRETLDGCSIGKAREEADGPGPWLQSRRGARIGVRTDWIWPIFEHVVDEWKQRLEASGATVTGFQAQRWQGGGRRHHRRIRQLRRRLHGREPHRERGHGGGPGGRDAAALRGGAHPCHGICARLEHRPRPDGVSSGRQVGRRADVVSRSTLLRRSARGQCCPRRSPHDPLPSGQR